MPSILPAKEKLSSLVDAISSNLSTQFNIALTQAQVVELKRVSATWLDSTQFKAVKLAANKPDFNQLLLQFQNMLEHEDAWKDTITAGGGQAILRFVSSAVAQAVYAQERATQEKHGYTARLPSSIFASSRSLGVRITRRRPSRVTVSLTRQGSEHIIIPAFSLFLVGNVKFFNRTAIIFGKGDVFPIESELIQGEVFTDTYASTGQPWAMYEVGVGDGSISDEDVYFYVDGLGYQRITDGLFNYGPNETVFYENTLPNGNVEINTGSGNYGVMPSSGSTIQIRYAVTQGVAAHSSAVELPVFCPDVPELQGISGTPISGGASPRDHEFYRQNAPYIRSKNDRAVLRRDYETEALEYPGMVIHDARVIGQKEIAPTKKWAQGVIMISVLTDLVMDDAQWRDFESYMLAKAMEGTTILRADPIPKIISAHVGLGVNPSYALEGTRLAAKSAISNAYSPRQGSLGSDYREHDISTILLQSSDPALKDSINWLQVISPTDKLITNAWNEYIKLSDVTIDAEYSNRTYSNRIGFDQ